MEKEGNARDKKTSAKEKRECKKFCLILTQVICRAQTKIYFAVTFICLHIKRLKYFLFSQRIHQKIPLIILQVLMPKNTYNAKNFQ